MRLCSASSPARFSICASGSLLQQRDRVVIQLTPASRIEIVEQAAGVLVPAPPQVARERPQLFLRRRDEPVHDAGLADDRRHLDGGRHQRLDLLVGEVARLERLHHQRALQHAVVDERHAEERLERLLAGLAEVLEARVRLRVLDRHRPDQLGDQADEPFVQAEAERADALGPQPHRGGEDQVDAVGLEQVRRAHVGAESLGDEAHDVLERLGWVVAGVGEGAELVERQHFVEVVRAG